MLIYLIYLIIFSLPLYLFRLKIFWVPTTVLELMICVLFIVWLVTKNRKQGSLFIIHYSLFIGVLLLLSGCIISSLVSSNKLTSLGILKGWFIGPLLFFMVLVSVVKTKKQIKNTLAVFGLSGAGVAVISIGHFLARNLTFDGRLRAFFLSPNHLAMYLAPALLIALYFLLTSKELKYFWFIVVGLTSIAFYFTFSYGAWLGVLVGFLFLLWQQNKSLTFVRTPIGVPTKVGDKTRLRLLICVVVLLIIVSAFFQLGSEKFQNFLFSTSSSLQSRLMIWKAALLILKDHPLWGIGLGTFQKYYLDYSSYFRKPYLQWAVPQPHNLLLAFWLQTGVLGLLGFVWIVVWFFKKGRKWVRARHGVPLQAVMIYILVHGLIDTTYWKNDLAIIFWLIVGLMVVLSRHS